jgi:hypothetical protein
MRFAQEDLNGSEFPLFPSLTFPQMCNALTLAFVPQAVNSTFSIYKFGMWIAPTPAGSRTRRPFPAALSNR